MHQDDPALPAYRRIFAQFDADGSGSVSTSELSQMCSALHFEVTETEVGTMMRDADPDGTGEITFERFYAAVHKNGGGTLSGMFETLKSVFDSFDEDKSGQVSTAELRNMCASVNMKVTDEELATIIREADADGSGVLDFGEFVVAVALRDNGLAEIYKKARALVAKAEKEGATWVSALQPLQAAARLAKSSQPARRAFPGAPCNASYNLVAEMGTPSDASGYERARDATLNFFVSMDTPFMVGAALSAIGIVVFGVLIVVAMFSVLFGLEVGRLTDLFDECGNCTLAKQEYIENHPTADVSMLECTEATFKTVDMVNDVPMQEVCTRGQQLFNFCIKMVRSGGSLTTPAFPTFAYRPCCCSSASPASDPTPRLEWRLRSSPSSSVTSICYPCRGASPSSSRPRRAGARPPRPRASTFTVDRRRLSGSSCRCPRGSTSPSCSTWRGSRTTSAS